MGAWDVKILSNDYALDEMPYVVEKGNILEEAKRLLDDTDLYNALIGIGMVDMSINGYDADVWGSQYGYDGWFKEVEKTDLLSLVDDALTSLEEVRRKDTGWFENCRKDRKKVLDTLEKRLKAAKKT